MPRLSYTTMNYTHLGQRQAPARIKSGSKNNNGTAWSFVDGDGPTGINYNTSNSAYIPRLTVFDGNLYAVWYEGTPNFKIRVKKYDGSAWSFVDGNGTSGINKSASAGAQYGFPTVYNNSLYVIWQETNGTANQIRVALMGPSNTAPTATNVTFTGNLKQGNTLTGTYAYVDAENDPEGTPTYKWYAAEDNAGTGKTLIASATTDTLTLTNAEVGKYIVFEVTPAATSGTPTGAPSSYTSAVAVQANAAPTATDVSFDGTLKQGGTLTGSYAYADEENDPEGTPTYKWYTAEDNAGTGKTLIASATANTLALTSAEAGKYIVFEVTPSATAGTPTGAPSSYTSAGAVLNNSAPTVSHVQISGSLKLNQTLTGTYLYNDDDQDAEDGTTFQWYTADDALGTNKTPIAGASGKTLVLKADQNNKHILFEVTPHAAAGSTSGNSVASPAVGPVGMLKGDANGDGYVTPADALLANKYIQGKITLTAEQKLALDMDNDNDVDAVDAQLILNVYLGIGG
ncbi:dockerin type I domain-containing protein [Paenibacillus sp. JDR-2]|uniref:dockerin type I domain-containing protein n=1 Tax=Paenibacillus sp. (strain JDR-2) TaxID=324057 RepID=UPI00167FDAD1|nr:dockerin type I domain-containing protein [Paenibacillus sp. JDR-2]